ncbi:hypothetical protein OH492_16415 [Vibrio chagasii]|nr:hypothetical protein [Vibrio chagasii]
MNINKDLMTTYILGAQLKELWHCESEVHAKAGSGIRGGARGCHKRVIVIKRVRTKTESLSSTAFSHRKLSAQHPHIGRDTTTKTKLIKRMGYGYRDTDYFLR